MTTGHETIDHEYWESLLGPYALHAVEPEESAALETHLLTCPRCRAELGGYLRAAPLLGTAPGDPPPGLWDEVLDTIGARPAGAMSPRLRRSIVLGRRWNVGVRPFVAAACLVLVLGAGAGALVGRATSQRGTSAEERLRQAAASVLSGPHTVVELEATSAASGAQRSVPAVPAVAQVVVGPGSQAYLVSSRLRPLGPGRTYQMWASIHGTAISLGTLGRAPGIAAFRVDPATGALMITAEPAGGVQSPDSPVLAMGSLVRR